MATETNIEMTAEQKEASCLRMAAYDAARSEWQYKRDDWKPAVKTKAYEALTRRWFAMNRDEQKAAGAASVLWYH